MSDGITSTDQMFSVRELAWHGLSAVLDQYRKSIEEALETAGLGWRVTRGDVLVVQRTEWIDDSGAAPVKLIPAHGFKANLRKDSGAVLGIVFHVYEVVDNRNAFRFLNALIGIEMHFETAGSLWGGHRVWCLAREPITAQRFERSVGRCLWAIDGEMGKVARVNRERTVEQVLGVFAGRGVVGDTTGNSPGSKWVAWNAVAEHLDYGRRYTALTSQVQRSFEDVALKQRAFDLVLAA